MKPKVKKSRLFSVSFCLIMFILLNFSFSSFVLSQEQSNETNTDFVLKTEIKIPVEIQETARLIFKLNEEEILLENLVILVAIWIMIFMIVLSVLKIFPFFEGWKSFVFGFIITSLISVGGAIESTRYFYVNILSGLGFLAKWGIFRVILSLLIFLLIAYVAYFFSKIIKNRIKIEQAREQGLNVGQQTNLSKLRKE